MNRFLEVAPSMQPTNEFLQAEQLRQEFVEIFNREKLKTLTLEEYAIGHGDNSNFCYWLEIKLGELGSIQGAFAQKFAVYYNAADNRYSWTHWTKEDFSNVRDMLLDLYDAGAAHDVSAIISNKLSPILKGKILSIYFPQMYLNVFAEHHLRYFLAQLGVVYDKKMDLVELREFLVNYKNAQKELSALSAAEFGNLLYVYFGSPSEQELHTSKRTDEHLLDEAQNIEIDSKITSSESTKRFADIPIKKSQKIIASNHSTYPRSSDKSIQALKDANYSCEIDAMHITFMRRDKRHSYTEAHHLIPMSAQDDFEFTLDTPANIVSLCSHCHNCLHYGAEWIELLRILYDDRAPRLKSVGLAITFSELKRYYSK